MHLFFSKHIDLILLNVILVSCFVFFQIHIDLPPRQELIFSTEDALTYLDVSNWISNGTYTESTAIRPVLYPLFLSTVLALTGEIGIFIIQSILWIVAINLIYSSIKHLTNNILYACIGSGIMLFNFSLMSLTAHALTEVATVFLLSLLIYLITIKRASFREPQFVLSLVWMLVLLTLVKPIFYIPTMLVVFVFIPIFYYKNLLLQRRFLFRLVLALSPLLCQMTLMFSKHDQFSVSKIGSHTFSMYFITQGIVQIEDLDHQQAVDKVVKLSSQEKLTYVRDNILTYSDIFLNNIKSNIQGTPTFLNYPIPGKNPKTTIFMIKYNNVSFYMHLVFLLLSLVVLVKMWRTSQHAIMTLIAILFVLNCYMIVMTGISFWQGDRLTLPAIALWSVLYPVLAHNFIQDFVARKNRLSPLE